MDSNRPSYAEGEEYTIHYRQGAKVLVVDTKKSHYHGLKWRDLGAWGKRKFENVLVLKNADEQRLPIKVRYI
jgi:hypothetical protein